MLSFRTICGPWTACFHTPVYTVRPRQSTSRGRPTFTATRRPTFEEWVVGFVAAGRAVTTVRRSGRLLSRLQECNDGALCSPQGSLRAAFHLPARCGVAPSGLSVNSIGTTGPGRAVEPDLHRRDRRIATGDSQVHGVFADP
jgi:hypothetical protein